MWDCDFEGGLTRLYILVDVNHKGVVENELH